MTFTSPIESRSLSSAPLPVLVPVALSAFLLFTVEPLVGRLLLPVFGGGPMIWTAVLLFFQVVLLLGYAYAHASVTWLGRWGPIAHLVLAVVAFVLLVRAPDAIGAGSARSAIDAVVSLIGFVGLPALVLAATTPIVSGWLVAAGQGQDHDPYRLYGLANGGALLALVIYPVLVEPRLGLGTQRAIWTLGFVGFGALLVAAVLGALSSIADRASRPGWIGLQETAIGASDVVTWARRARWLLFAAVPSGLLAVITTLITTDLGAMPLLWVVPLAIYLISLIMAFARPSGRVVRMAVATTPALVIVMWATHGPGLAWPLLAIGVVQGIGFLVLAIALHGRLAQDRPHPAHLTDFYLTMSAGGVVGSIFASVIAPTVFPDLWEFPILLVGALVALAIGESLPSRSAGGMTFAPFLGGFVPRFVPYLLVAGALIGLLAATGSPALVLGVAWLAIGALVLIVGGRRWMLVFATTAVVLATFFLPLTEFRGRSFMGVTRVVQSSEAGLTVLINGTTVHGSQWMDPALAGTPTAYYGPGGPAADVFAVGAPPPESGANRVGVVGMGAGELSAYADPFTILTYFEVDPVVVRVAQDPALFTYIADAPGDPKVVVGDGRRSLLAEADGTFNLLVIDAFSSNAIPVHLLTVEALTDALRTVGPDGVIALHVSNRWYDLAPPVAAAFAQLGLTTLERSGGGEAAGELPSRWLATSRDAERLSRLRALGWEATAPSDRPFTDDYADLLSYLKLGF